MEIILAIVVASAVIFFGALISMGNERQRKSIDNLHDQFVQWALRDLQIKKGEMLQHEVNIDDPLAWLNKVAINVFKMDIHLQSAQTIKDPNGIICNTSDISCRVIFTPCSPKDINSMKRLKTSQLNKYADKNPLLTLPKNVLAKECSALNNSELFDLELSVVWKELTGEEISRFNLLWIYMIP